MNNDETLGFMRENKVNYANVVSKSEPVTMMGGVAREQRAAL